MFWTLYLSAVKFSKNLLEKSLLKQAAQKKIVHFFTK
jgi:hypothetical protein